MRYVILFLIFVFAVNALAQENTSQYQYMFFAGLEGRVEENIQKDVVIHNLYNYSLGIGLDQYRVLLERATFSENTGNATLHVKRNLEDYLLWGHYIAFSANYLEPFIGLGIGAYKNSVDTSLAGSTTTNSSNFKLLGGASFGVGLHYKVVFLSLEARLLFGDELDRQPSLGSLFKLGFIF